MYSKVVQVQQVHVFFRARCTRIRIYSVKMHRETPPHKRLAGPTSIHPLLDEDTACLSWPHTAAVAAATSQGRERKERTAEGKRISCVSSMSPGVHNAHARMYIGGVIFQARIARRAISLMTHEEAVDIKDTALVGSRELTRRDFPSAKTKTETNLVPPGGRSSGHAIPPPHRFLALLAAQIRGRNVTVLLLVSLLLLLLLLWLMPCSHHDVVLL